MKLERLTSTSPTLTREAAQRARSVADESHWHVGPAEGVEADRQRSLQQELALAETARRSPGRPDDGRHDFPADDDSAGAATQARETAEQVAEQLTALGDRADALLRADLPLLPSLSIDDRA